MHKSDTAIGGDSAIKYLYILSQDPIKHVKCILHILQGISLSRVYLLI